PYHTMLKVLRLSRPSLATQFVIPPLTGIGDGNLHIDPQASLAYPSSNEASSFPLTPLLTLPTSFGLAYVGETFTCALCTQHEDEIKVEIQTPAHPTGVQIEVDETQPDEEGDVKQSILRFDLQEEGSHVLAVTVRASDTGKKTRKLFQFVVQPLLSVRSKITKRRTDTTSKVSWVLEAQIENVGQTTTAVLERIWLSPNEKEGVREVPLSASGEDRPVLKPQDVEQVMFLVASEVEATATSKRLPLAQLNVSWRTAMGQSGKITTGWLVSRSR
ncbi:hypothetical protein K470DRAFT_209297, partial [Piedraia hortae CBS 480.64]